MYQRKKRKIPEINSSASADIAFLLLIFFLVTSSMGSGKGIFKRLNPAISSHSETKKTEIQKRNLLAILIDGNNQVFCNQIPVEIGGLRHLAKDFIANPTNLDSLPEKKDKKILYFETIRVTSDHIIALEIDRNADYQAYISVQNELIGAYNELRDEMARKKFNRPFSGLEPDKQAAIREIYPQRISEQEVAGNGKEAAE